MLIRRTPEPYTVRAVIRFAYFPRKTREGWVWLEHVLCTQSYYFYTGWTTTVIHRVTEKNR